MIVQSGEPIQAVLAYTSAAAGLSALAVVPYALKREVPLYVLGGAYAFAAGCMLGIGYLLMQEALTHATLPVMIGAGLGVAYTHWTHRYSGTEEIDTLPGDQVGRDQGYKLILLYTLHSGSEGLAIGLAMAANLRLGAIMAAALAVHNVAEGLGLAAILKARFLPLRHMAGICVIARIPQVLLAIVAFAVVPSFEGLLGPALGFAAGSLLFLTMTELLPDAYHHAGRTGIAFIVSACAGAVMLVQSWVG